MRTLHTADIVLPMGGAPLIEQGGVVVESDGTILAVGERRRLGMAVDAEEHHALLMPGVLNAHVHLTDARRDERVPGGEGLNAWVRRLMAARGEEAAGDATPGAAALDHAVAAALLEMMRAGTVAVGEVANNYGTFDAIARSGMRCRFIHELIGFRGVRAPSILDAALQSQAATAFPQHIHHTLAAHAPYSVSPELMQLIVETTGGRGRRFHQHLAEDPAERELYMHGGGPWRDYLEQVGAWDDAWAPPGTGPVAFYEKAGLLSERFVAVHLAEATREELAILGRHGVRAILSPASNLHITGLLPDLEAIVREGIPFALGTDGRGSGLGVDVFDEARILLERWPDLPPGILLEALTSVAADTLELPELGRLAVGARPGLLALDLALPGTDLRQVERGVIGSAAGERRLYQPAVS
ncbi:MAG TPA: amidohydrolase family protein [Candidatus Kapabacteria bacterium]|nr:amidohydrolase family protein [Candidatus Kapabacteria bacterium]